jgi:hypothetical protein
VSRYPSNPRRNRSQYAEDRVYTPTVSAKSPLHSRQNSPDTCFHDRASSRGASAPDPGDELRQLEQVLDAKWGAPCRDRHEGIRRGNTGPLRWQGDQPTGVVVEVNAVLAPVVAVRHQGELTPPERVEGMGDLEGLARTVEIGCI